MILFKTKSFSNLSLEELYTILKLRQEVFIVEQNCPYLDADGKDGKANHVIGYENGVKIVSYCRILPPGLSFENFSSIGRVVTALDARKNRYGLKMMVNAIAETKRLHPKHTIKISAQQYLDKFYTNLGFSHTGKEYLEDGIPHIEMILKE